METFQLIDQYATSKLNGYKSLGIDSYTINGSIIKISYSYQFDWSEDTDDRNYENSIEVDLLDYITWVFNQK